MDELLGLFLAVILSKLLELFIYKKLKALFQESFWPKMGFILVLYTLNDLITLCYTIGFKYSKNSL